MILNKDENPESDSADYFDLHESGGNLIPLLVPELKNQFLFTEK
jgi:hypothetical protein